MKVCAGVCVRVHIQTCLLTPHRARINTRDLGQCFYRKLADDLWEAKFGDGSTDFDAAPPGPATEGFFKELLCLIWRKTPTCLFCAPLPCFMGGPGRPGAVGFISCSPFVVSLIVQFNVLDQNLWICRAWGCTQTAWEIKTGIILSVFLTVQAPVSSRVIPRVSSRY